MMKHEFENLLGGPVPAEDYAEIEIVYTWYPGIADHSAIAAIYLAGGMLLIRDLLPRATQIMAYEAQRVELAAKIDRLSHGGN